MFDRHRVSDFGMRVLTRRDSEGAAGRRCLPSARACLKELPLVSEAVSNSEACRLDRQRTFYELVS